MRQLFISIIVLSAIVLIGQPAMATVEVQGHPLIKPYPDSKVWASQVVSFDKLALPTGQVYFDRKLRGSALKSSVPVEGKVTAIDYRTPRKRSALEVLENYKQGLKKGGFEILYSCREKECGHGDVTEKYYSPSVGYPETGLITAKLVRDTGDVYVMLVVDQNNAHNYLIVVEAKPMEKGLVKVDANALLNDIERTGHASIYGIYFDTNKSEVKPESKQALGEIAKLLNNKPDLKLFVVGHTDNVGQLDYNKHLSMRRATAVVKVLVNRYGIDSSRLLPDGVGPLAPVLSNSSDVGRAKNRRVELVAQ